MKNYLKLTLLFCSLCLCSCDPEPIPESHEDIEAILEKGGIASDENRDAKAIRAFKVIRKNTKPNDQYPDQEAYVDAAIGEITIHFENNQLTEAIEIGKEWIEAYPSESAYESLVSAYLESKEATKAQKLCQEGIDKNFALYGEMADVYRILGPIEKVIYYLEMSIQHKEDLDNPLTLFDNFKELAFYYKEKEDFSKALSFLKQGIVALPYPKFKNEFFEIINQLFSEAKLSEIEIESHLKKLVQHFPKEDHFWNLIINFYLQGGYDKQAETMVDRALVSIGNAFETNAREFYEKILRRNLKTSIATYKLTKGKVTIFNHSEMFDWKEYTVHLHLIDDGASKSRNDFFFTQPGLMRDKSQSLDMIGFKNALGEPLNVFEVKQFQKLRIELKVSYKGIEQGYCMESFYNFLTKKVYLVNCSNW